MTATDWLAAAAEHRRRHPGDAVTGNRPVQVHRALRFLRDRAHDGDDTIPARAAAIVSALPTAPPGEAILGVRDADVAPELPRELLEKLGADVPAPVIEPTAVIAQPRKAKAKPKTAAKAPAQPPADDPETAEAVAGLAERADAIIAGLTTGQDGAA